MKSYQSGTPRTAFGFVAVALTALTLGIWVVAPTKVEPSKQTLPLPTVQAVVPAAVDAGPTRIEVIAARQPMAGAELVSHVQPPHAKRKAAKLGLAHSLGSVAQHVRDEACPFFKPASPT